jgi:hypothetical protein
MDMDTHTCICAHANVWVWVLGLKFNPTNQLNDVCMNSRKQAAAQEYTGFRCTVIEIKSI